MSDRVVIVGASHAGVQAAQSLRQGGWAGPITLLSDESTLPYQRPDLSKAYLVEDRPDPQILKGMPFFETNDIALRPSTRAVAIDRTAKQVVIQSGETFVYDHLILATGATARRLPVTAPNIVTLRNVADARAIRSFLAPGQHIVIIGGGFIGLEVAAAARKHGARVTVFEAAARCLTRALPSIITDYLLARHADEGVTIRTGCGPLDVICTDGMATSVRLTDGTGIECDALVVGIGCTANTELATQTGLTLASGGIAVDQTLTTSDPAIMAIGDCAAFPVDGRDAPMRLESIQNAADQARHAAAVLLGTTRAPYAAVPWFWSHQYDIRLQMAGFPTPDAPMIVRGDPAKGGFSALHLDVDHRLLAAYSINATADHMAARKLIASRRPLDPAKATDPAHPLLQAI